jgi:hypothetical protein
LASLLTTSFLAGCSANASLTSDDGGSLAGHDGSVEARDAARPQHDAAGVDAKRQADAGARDASKLEASPAADAGRDADVRLDAAGDTGAGDATHGSDGHADAPTADARRADAAPAGGTVGGVVTGLAGTGLTLANGTANLAVTANGPFAFPGWLPSATSYSVSVVDQPVTPSQTCVVTSGTGDVGAADVTSVAVACTTDTFTIGGSIQGLTGSVVISDDAGDALMVSADGPFTMPTSYASGKSYTVTVGTPLAPANQSCVVTAFGTGMVTSSAITDVSITCTVHPPAMFTAGQVSIQVDIDTSQNRLPISPLIYGINADITTGLPARVLSAITMTRRGGDRGNSYNWENDVSNGGLENCYGSDGTYAGGPLGGAPAATDLAMINSNRAAGRATMVPFVLNDFVAKSDSSSIDWYTPGWNRGASFNQEVLVLGAPYPASPNLTDGVVYTDEHLAYMMSKFPGVDITAAGQAGQLLVGIDNEADLWEYNFPMLQNGSGDTLTVSDVTANAPSCVPNGTNGSTAIGQRVTGPEFTQRLITFATQVKKIAPEATIVGPAHFGYDGWMCWHELVSQWSDLGNWFMDDFLAAVRTASTAAGVRLLDIWDMHWYPQATFNGVTVSALDNDASPLTAAEIDAIVQGPRSYWDTTYDEGSWITSVYHLNGPAYMLTRLQAHIASGYPGTGLGVSEYFPGGLNHISSGLAVVDSLGVFQRMGIALAAMWPLGSNSALSYAFGGLELVHDADGNGLRFADTSVLASVPSADVATLSAYAGMDTPDRVTVLVVNKTSSAETVGLSITNADLLSKVTIYRIDASSATPYLVSSGALTLSNAYAYDAPPLSASLLVLAAN